MEVLLDLERLVAALIKSPSRAGSLFVLREIASQSAPVDPSDSEPIAETRTAVARLRASLATVEAVRKRNRAVRWDLGKGEMVERHLGGISCASFHDCVVAAASEMITTGEPRGAGSDPNWFVNEIIKTISDKDSWARWKSELEREHHLAQILPLEAPPPPEKRRLQTKKAKASAPTPRQGLTVDQAIAAFRVAHADWARAIPRVGYSITARDAGGNAFTISYWLPSGAHSEAGGEPIRFGFAKPEWSSMLQPILVPTDEVWRAAYDRCLAARIQLANAADALAVAASGTNRSSQQLRSGAQQLVEMLRNVPPVWPTKLEVDLAFEINNRRISEYSQSIAEEQRQREAAAAAATEERRKQKAERMADALIAWEEQQKRSSRKRQEPPAQATGSKRGGPSQTPARRRPTKPELPDMAILVLRVLPKATEPAIKTLASIAKKIGISPQPSISAVSRAISMLRNCKPPLADKASYRLTPAGERYDTE